MKSNFIHNLVNKAAVALVFAATALSVDASRGPAVLLTLPREASSSSVVAAASAVPEAFNVLGGLNGLGKDMYVTIIKHMTERKYITGVNISSFIMTSKNISEIRESLRKKDTRKVFFAVLDKRRNEGRIVRNPRIFSKFYDYWLENADGRRIMKDVDEGRKTAEEAYNDFRAFIEGKKKMAMRPLENFWIFKKELGHSEHLFKIEWSKLSKEDPRDLCEEQFDAWLEEDKAAFESVMLGTMSAEKFGDYLSDFKRVLISIKGTLEVPDGRSYSTVYLLCTRDPRQNLTRFWFEFFFNKIGMSVYDFERKTSCGAFIHMAAEYSQIEAIKYCLDNRVDINEQIRGEADKGFTPLMSAVHGKSPEAVDFLLQNGANPYLRDVHDRNAWDLAYMGGLRVKIILRKWMRDHPESFYSAE